METYGIEEIYKVKEEKQYPGDIDIINMGGNEDLGRLSVLWKVIQGSGWVVPRFINSYYHFILEIYMKR